MHHLAYRHDILGKQITSHLSSRTFLGAASRRRAGRPAERPRSGPGSWGPWLPPSGGLLMVPGCPQRTRFLLLACAYFLILFFLFVHARARGPAAKPILARVCGRFEGCANSVFFPVSSVFFPVNPSFFRCRPQFRLEIS